MWRLLSVAAIAAVASADIQRPYHGDGDFIPRDFCDSDYECEYSYRDLTGITWNYDLSPLCNGGDYYAQDSGNHSYYFNICGIAHMRCLPTWSNVYQYGVAVQMWGDDPPCNQTNPECTDPDTGVKQCCTKDCQVLGVGIPFWKPINPSNPFFGGLSITHMGVPPASDDPFHCPFNTKTGQQDDRSVTYEILCDATVPPGTVDVSGAVQNGTNACSYIITMKSIASCGCAPDCANRNCGSSGCDGGFCGGLGGGCPIGYKCTSEQVCCKPDCNNRDCGHDGCGGSCGNCTSSQICDRQQQCASFGPLPGSGVHTPGGTIAGAFFGGIISAVVIGGVGFFVYNRRSGGYSFGSGSGSGSGGGDSFGSSSKPSDSLAGSSYQSDAPATSASYGT